MNPFSPGWKSTFYFQAGLSALIFVLAILTMERDTHHLDPTLDRRVDWLGAFLVTSGLVILTFSLGDGETAKPSQWKTPYIIALLVLGVLLLGAFVWWEHLLGQSEAAFLGKAADPEKASTEEGTKRRSFLVPPLLRLSLFKRAKGRLAVVLVVVFFVWAGFTGWAYYAVVSAFDRRFASLSHASDRRFTTP